MNLSFGKYEYILSMASVNIVTTKEWLLNCVKKFFWGIFKVAVHVKKIFKSKKKCVSWTLIDKKK